MKKIIATVTSILLAFACVGCSGQDASTSKSPGAEVTSKNANATEFHGVTFNLPDGWKVEDEDSDSIVWANPDDDDAARFGAVLLSWDDVDSEAAAGKAFICGTQAALLDDEDIDLDTVKLNTKTIDGLPVSYLRYVEKGDNPTEIHQFYVAASEGIVMLAAVVPADSADDYQSLMKAFFDSVNAADGESEAYETAVKNTSYSDSEISEMEEFAKQQLKNALAGKSTSSDDAGDQGDSEKGKDTSSEFGSGSNSGSSSNSSSGDASVSQKNALDKALDYLAFTNFSHDGLIDQLEYEGFSTEDATYAADNCGANWNEQALGKANDYLSFMAFSYSGLIDQLEYEGFTTEQATYGADTCGADWNEQAAKKAQEYLEYSSFSRSGLIDQLEYEGFTAAQAEYGANAVGL